MTELYPVGSTIPVQPWLIESIQQDLSHKREANRAVAAYRQHLVQRFGAWRVFPVKVGRWVRTSYLSEYGDDGWGWLLAPVLLPWRPGMWKFDEHFVQVLDPATGVPIAEHRVSALKSKSRWVTSVQEWAQIRELAILGDPRVGGLFAPVSATSREEMTDGNRRDHTLPRNPAEFERVAAQLINEPYRDFAHRDDGPWLADHPQKPKGHTNGWKPSPWYRPS